MPDSYLGYSHLPELANLQEEKDFFISLFRLFSGCEYDLVKTYTGTGCTSDFTWTGWPMPKYTICGHRPGSARYHSWRFRQFIRSSIALPNALFHLNPAAASLPEPGKSTAEVPCVISQVTDARHHMWPVYHQSILLPEF